MDSEPTRRDGTAWRITVRGTPDGIGVYNPSRRKVGLVVFLLIWLCGWSVGVVFALSEILRSGNPLAVDLFLLVWVWFWTLGGLLVLAVAGWHLFGVEKLFLIEGGGIVTERGFGPFTRRKVFAADHVSDVGYPADRHPRGASGVFASGAVRFFANGEPRSFGIELDEEEADRVVRLIEEFLERNRPAAAMTDVAGRAADGDGAPEPRAG